MWRHGDVDLDVFVQFLGLARHCVPQRFALVPVNALAREFRGRPVSLRQFLHRGVASTNGFRFHFGNVLGGDHALLQQLSGVRLDGVSFGPLLVKLLRHVTSGVRLRVVKTEVRIGTQIKHVVVMGVPTHAHRDHFEQGWAIAVARALCGPSKGGR